ncbi:hypothetical protein PsorP6_004478 [Peronosclerospora sorghi]|uniref:Uncharacterized protein n=1 Tax=Peronosclerospora sorghi TaxID=230839 RepID=A0ACC0VQV2_9STRA|nr:hypothetical protein PsorP6_004478 [Peronosclerospora sorghi]
MKLFLRYSDGLKSTNVDHFGTSSLTDVVWKNCVVGKFLPRFIWIRLLVVSIQQERSVAASYPFHLSEGFLETNANDEMRAQATTELLVKHEFPRVIILDGDYALTVNDLTDHDILNCKLCQYYRSMQAILLSAMRVEKNPREVLSGVVARTRTEV